ncbi:hypothetical protein SAMN05421858_3367 [Haladaptatus litoreus]|uniref:Uncharacterized protein n=1 Tax=Haladaptatus litoreus TaxID=553468 RepID=A0A1N7CZJ0_9EURY|nr:hypothetical protein SAMN05421858_3367 [Haladaptatus litoreus]
MHYGKCYADTPMISEKIMQTAWLSRQSVRSSFKQLVHQ